MRAIGLRNLVMGVLGVALFAHGTAQAFTVSDFDTVTNPADALFFCFDLVGAGNSSQIDLDQLDFGLAVTLNGNQLVFEFVNVSPISSVIAQIYFDDGGDALIGNGAQSELYAAALAAQGVIVERADADAMVLAGLGAAWAALEGESP